MEADWNRMGCTIDIKMVSKASGGDARVHPRGAAEEAVCEGMSSSLLDKTGTTGIQRKCRVDQTRHPSFPIETLRCPFAARALVVVFGRG